METPVFFCTLTPQATRFLGVPDASVGSPQWPGGTRESGASPPGTRRHKGYHFTISTWLIMVVNMVIVVSSGSIVVNIVVIVVKCL